MGWSEKDYCIKCDKRGKVLSCSDSSCPIAVHERCLGFPAKFDDVGNFYCPYCSYRRATEESRQAREKALLRKKALSSFIDMEMINGDKHIHEVGKSEQKRLWKLRIKGKGNCNLGTDNENKLDEATIQKSLVQPGEEQEEDEFASERTRSVSLPKETDIAMLGRETNVLSSKYGGSARPSECKDRVVVVGHQTPSGPIVACGRNGVYSEEEETVHNFQMVEIGRQILLEHHKQHNDDQPAKTAKNHIEDNHFSDFPLEEKQGRENFFSNSAKSVDKDADPIEEDKGKIGEVEMQEQVQENSSSFANDPTMPVALQEKGEFESTDTLCRELDPAKARKRVKRNCERSGHPIDVNCLRKSCQISSSALRDNTEQIGELNAPTELKQVTEPSPWFSRNLFPSVRRKKLLWKDDEEEMLREGVRKYSTTDNKNIPWRKILEFGRHVFHDTRTPGDLKDKWRNIMAKER